MVTGDLFLLPRLSISARTLGPCTMRDKEGRDTNWSFLGFPPSHKLEVCCFHGSSSSQHSNLVILHFKGKLGDKSGLIPALSEA